MLKLFKFEILEDKLFINIPLFFKTAEQQAKLLSKLIISFTHRTAVNQE